MNRYSYRLVVIVTLLLFSTSALAAAKPKATIEEQPEGWHKFKKQKIIYGWGPEGRFFELGAAVKSLDLDGFDGPVSTNTLRDADECAQVWISDPSNDVSSGFASIGNLITNATVALMVFHGKLQSITFLIDPSNEYICDDTGGELDTCAKAVAIVGDIEDTFAEALDCQEKLIGGHTTGGRVFFAGDMLVKTAGGWQFPPLVRHRTSYLDKRGNVIEVEWDGSLVTVRLKTAWLNERQPWIPTTTP